MKLLAQTILSRVSAAMLIGYIVFASNVLALPQAGTSIVNVGSAEYINPDNTNVQIVSNPALVIVGSGLAVDLQTDRLFTVTPGQQVYYPHKLVNIGNTADSYTVSLDQKTIDTGDFVFTNIVLDINENGIADAGEPVLDTTSVLQPDEFIHFVVVATVPDTATALDNYSLDIKAVSNQDSSISDINIDGVELNDTDAIIALNKDSSESCAKPLIAGQQFDYNIAFSSVGIKAPASRIITIDGNDQQGVLIEDTLSSSLNLVNNQPVVAPQQGQFVVQTAAQTNTNNWLSFASWNGTDLVKRVAVLYPVEQLETNESGRFSFSVVINENAVPGVIENTASIDIDANNSAEFSSNTVCNTIANSVDFDLDPNRRITLSISDTDTPVVFTHTLTNKGLVDDSYLLSLDDSLNDSGNTTEQKIYIDNGDGVFNELSDTLNSASVESVSAKVSGGNSVPVKSGDTITLFVTSTVPAGFAVSDSIVQTISAVSVLDNTLTDSHTETIDFIANGPSFTLEKTTSRFCELTAPNTANQATADRLLPNEEFTYTLSFSNLGDAAPAEQNYTIDGESVSGIILFDDLAYGLFLVGDQNFNLPAGVEVAVLTYANRNAGQWIRYSAWNSTDPVAQIGVLYPKILMGRGASQSFSFDVRVVSTATSAAEFYNTAFFDYDSDGIADVSSNQVCNLVKNIDLEPNAPVPEAQIRFLSPTLDLILSRTAPEHAGDEFIDTTLYRLDTDVIAYDPSTDGVFIEVTSSTLREGDDYIITDDGRRQVVVDVESAGTGDTAQVVLRETFPGSGVYRSIRTLILSDVTPNGGGVCPPDQTSDIDYNAETIGECRLLSQQDDDLIVSITDTGINKRLEDDAIVDPLGIVFNANTLQPVEGATVVVCTHLPAGENSDPLFDDGIANDQCGAFGELAIDPFSPSREPLPIQVTGADGFYQYAFLFAGDYFIDINPPAQFAWPSASVPAQFAGQPAIGRSRTLEVLDPSYGINGAAAIADSGVFTLNAIRPILVVDLPVDPVVIDLNVSSNCDANGRVAGDIAPLTYTVNFTNSGNLTPPERTISVDGVNTSGVLFESRLPFEATPFANVPAVIVPGGVALVQTYADLDTNNWIAFNNWDGITPVSQIGALLSATDLEPNESGSMAFEVDVTDNLTDGTQLRNTISVDVDADGSAESQTQASCNVSGPNAEIRFLAPNNTLRAADQAPDFNSAVTLPNDFVDIGQYILSDSTFNTAFNSTSDGVYIQLNSTAIPDASFTILADGRRQLVVDVTSTITNETTSVVLQETSEGSGIYRSVVPLILSQLQSGNGNVCPGANPTVDYVADPGPACILRSAPSDNLVVSFFDDLGRHEDRAIVDPLGVVFDSQSLQPVPGATVSIRNLDGSLPLDPFTLLELQPQVTGADGAYNYPFMFPGTYYLDVQPPIDYAFPSVFDAATFAGTQFNIIDPSYGRNGFNNIVGNGEFTLDAINDLLVVDFPVDIFGDAQLLIEKSASVNEVELGGLVEYTVTVKNVGEAPVSNLVVEDKLPYGFKYVERTLRIDGVKVADPNGAPGPVLMINAGSLARDTNLTINYYLQATAGAVDSDGINVAVARANAGSSMVTSNVARAKVELIRRGVLSDKAYIFGKIFVDGDCNNVQSLGEWPIGAVKVYMEDGTYAITDENGQYSLYGLDPGLHIIKVDPLTMPKGLTLKPIDNRHAADGDSRFVDLVNGEYHRADFAAACPPAEMVEDIQANIVQRNQSINANWMLDEAERFDPKKQAALRTDRQRAVNGDISHGLVGTQQTSAGINGQVGLGVANQSLIEATSYNVAETIEEDSSDLEIMPLTQEIVKTVTAAQAKSGDFLWPKADTSLYGRFMVVIRTGVAPTLYLNGQAVPEDNLGEQYVNKKERAQVLAWYGLQLKPGSNLLEVKGKDPFGNMRTLASKTFHSPGVAESLVIEAAKPTLAADGGRSAAEITIKLLDGFGKPARGVHFVTVETNDGLWVEADIQDQNPGYQTRVKNGQRTLHLRSSEYTGDVTIKASVNTFSSETTIAFVASNRSLVVAGVAEAGYQQASLSDDGSGPTAQNDGLSESELDTRAAIFLKGRVKGDMHLTLSYDTDKDSDEDLLRDINPNEYYPIPGDNSIRGFEAQSRSKLYAKLEKERHSLLWGDYVTDLESTHRDLSRVQRTLTGIKGIYDNGRLRGLVFGAQEEDSFQQLEIPANGTALLYRIPNGPVVRNSEVLELVSRDRDSRALIVNSESLQRFVDYTVDYVTGDIRFTRAIPTLDENLNPNFIRISYSTEGDGTDYTVAGARAEFDVNNKVTVGASYTTDENTTTGNTITGGFINVKPTEQSNIIISAASMSHENSTPDGDALMVEAKQQWKNGSNTTASYGKADIGFTNGGSGVSADNQEIRINHTQKVTDKLNIVADYLESESLSVDNNRESLSLTADYKLKEWSLRGGSRSSENSSNGNVNSAETLIVGASRGFTLLGRGGSLNTEYEYETGDQHRKRWAADASWQAFEKAKVYGRYEQLNSLTGTSGVSTNQEQTSASFGVETDWIPSTTVYNEYRMRGVTDGRNLEAASGVRGDYEIIPGLKISPTLEVINTMEGATDNSSTAVSFGLSDSRDKNARKLLRVESRFDDNRNYYGFDGTYVARVSLNWSSFFREDLRITENKGADNQLDHVFTVGFAHRPRLENKYHALWLYQWKREESSVDREVHLFSTHQNLQLSDDWIVSGRLGLKYEQYDLLDTRFNTNVALMDGRLIWDMTRRIDLDIHGGVLATNDGDELRYSLGLGVNYLLNRNLRINAGYNLAGFKEKDLDGEGYNAQGPYIGLQFKFDEKAFDWLAHDPTAVLESNTGLESGNE